MAAVIDINADLGESFGVWKIGADQELLASITSANVACGFHGGDPAVMAQTVRAAKAKGVRVGAHPGLPDLVGFGRRPMEISPDAAYRDTLYQIGALDAFCRAEDWPLQHVKPHGQLNNMAVKDKTLAQAIVQAVQDFGKNLILIAYGGELLRAAEQMGIAAAHEVYADRAYNADGTLVARGAAGAVLHDAEAVVERAVRMVEEGRVRALTGEWVELRPDTICVHGDTPGAAELAARLLAAFSVAGVACRPIGETLAR